MDSEYEQLKSDVLDEIESIEQTLKDLTSIKKNLVGFSASHVSQDAPGANSECSKNKEPQSANTGAKMKIIFRGRFAVIYCFSLLLPGAF
jgi:hypothetical protein